MKKTAKALFADTVRRWELLPPDERDEFRILMQQSEILRALREAVRRLGAEKAFLEADLEALKEKEKNRAGKEKHVERNHAIRILTEQGKTPGRIASEMRLMGFKVKASEVKSVVTQGLKKERAKREAHVKDILGKIKRIERINGAIQSRATNTDKP